MRPLSLSRAAGLFGIASASAALLNVGLMALAVDGELSRLYDFGGLYDVDASGARLLVASMVIDAAFYLCLVPVAFALARPGAHRLAWLQRAAGALYGLCGAAGALTLALLWPELIEEARGGSEEAMSRFRLVTDVVYRFVWNLACASLGALWWLTAATQLWRERPRVALVSLVLGAVSALEAAAVASGALGLATALLDAYLALLPAFALVAGLSLFTEREGAHAR